jgi:thiamine-monophosphate kinase
MREFAFLDRVFASNAALPNSVLVPPGDDMAVVRVGRGTRELVVSIGLHIATENPQESVEREEQGVRAMRSATAALALACGLGESPARVGVASVVNLLAPARLDMVAAEAFQAGLERGAHDASTPLVGGDFAVFPGDSLLRACVCAVAASDRPTQESGHALERHGAKATSCGSISIATDALPDHELLVACDAAIEGRHAPLGCDPAVLARKAVLRNLSDVAAMGNARPIAIAAGLFAPDTCDAATIAAIERGLRETGARWGAPLRALAIEREPRPIPLAVCVAILAAKARAQVPVARRCDARAGDGVYVTGSIGGAWDARTGLGRHLDFEPRISAAHELVATLGARLGAMIDVSDGLGRDLGHIAHASGVSIEVELSAVPVPDGVDALAAIGHGEDYELAFTARGEVPRSVAGVPVTRIGTVCRDATAPGRVLVRCATREFDASLRGFEHEGQDPR